MLLILAFIFQSISVPAQALASDTINKKDNEIQSAVISLESEEDSIELYEDDSESSEVLELLEDGEEVIVLETFDELSFVEYLSNEEEDISGYVLNDVLEIDEDEDDNEV